MATSTGDYYQMLGVSRESTPEEIKKAYRRHARTLHPDVNPDPEAQEQFKALTTAYEVLSDPQKREMYDLGGDPFGGASQGASGFGNFGGLGDIMDAFFGGGGGTRGPRSRVRQGADALLAIELDLHETAFGVDKEITVETAAVCGLCTGSGTAAGTHPETCPTCKGRGEIQLVQRSFLGQVMTTRPCQECRGTGSLIKHPCPECGGEGRVRARRTLTVSVPAGVENGMRIRLTGQGEVGPGGGPSGDLYVEIHEREHPVFEREGSDLHCKVTLPMTAAALGTELKLQTLDSEEQVAIKPGTQSGTVISLRARGVPRLRGTGRGDLHVHVEVTTPSKLDAEQERLLRQLAELRGEEHPDGSAPQGSNLFGRLRGAFK